MLHALFNSYLEAASYKVAVVQSLTSHLANNAGLTHKLCSMDVILLAPLDDDDADAEW